MSKRGILIASCIAAFGILIAVSGASAETGIKGAELLPPNARPGECYARVFVPAAFKDQDKKVLKMPAAKKRAIEQTKFKTVEKKVLTKEASEKIIPVAAVYETVEEKVLVKAATKKLVPVPAKYETVEEKVIDAPAHTVWKKGRGPIERVDYNTGEIMCLVEVPATYKTVKKQVLKTPATVKEVEVPAEYKTVKKKVVKAPATFKKETIPAEYAKVKVQEIAEAPQVVETNIPAEYETVATKIKISDGEMAWRPVLCETNLDKDKVLAVQKSLRKAGYDPGIVDGAIGKKTVDALRQYQRDKGLAVGSLTIETLKNLGLTS